MTLDDLISAICLRCILKKNACRVLWSSARLGAESVVSVMARR